MIASLLEYVRAAGGFALGHYQACAQLALGLTLRACQRLLVTLGAFDDSSYAAV